MVDNQHKLIKGYKDLSEEQISYMNEIKGLGVELGALADKLGGLDITDKRWVNIGITDLQKGLMALTRSVARPDFF